MHVDWIGPAGASGSRYSVGGIEHRFDLECEALGWESRLLKMAGR